MCDGSIVGQGSLYKNYMFCMAAGVISIQTLYKLRFKHDSSHVGRFHLNWILLTSEKMRGTILVLNVLKMRCFGDLRGFAGICEIS